MPPPAEPVLPASAAAGARAATLATARRARVELATVGVMSFALNAFTAYLLVFRWGIFVTDAMARTRSAWQVFFSGEPKLANVGFVWAPLPTLLQLPLVLIPGLRQGGLSGNAVTVLAGMGTAVLLAFLLRRAQLPAALRWLVLATYVLNPAVLYYSANGMSEMTLVFFCLLALSCYLRWRDSGQWVMLAASGMAAGLAFLARYDALLLVGALVVAVGAEALARRPDEPRFAETSVLMFAVPPAYVAFIWVLANWAIMGDPIYFARSAYSNAGQIGYQLALLPWLLPVKGNLWAAARLTLVETWNVFPAFVVLSAFLVGLALVRRTTSGLGALTAAWSLTLFTGVNLYLGQSAMFFRYFIAAVPMAYPLAVVVLGMLPRWRTAAALGLVILFGVSGYSTARTMLRATEWGQWNDAFITSLLTDRPAGTWEVERELAGYINSQTQGLILVDDFQGYRVIFFTGAPARFVTPADSFFDDYLGNPVGRASYLLVSEPILEGQLNQINVAYPELYEHGGAWVQLEKENAIWRLYRVTGPPSQVPLSDFTRDVTPP